ncbi:MAG: proton-conducting transporter membrane subunit [Acidimicrobiales bacterium]
MTAVVWALVLVPVLAGAAIAAGVAGRRPPGLGAAAVAAMVATLGLGVAAAVGEPAATWRWGGGLDITARVDGVSRLMVVLVPAVAVAVVAYAASYLADDDGLRRLLGLLVAFVGAMELLVVAADLLTLLVAWELVGACSWALIGHHWAAPEVPGAAAQAFVATRFGDLGLFLAAGAALAARHSLAFASLAGPRSASLDVVAAGVLVAAAAKSAQLPFSPWLFSAMAGPTPVSALLHSATMVAAGGYLVAKLGPALDVTGWFLPAVAVVGLATALAGGVVAAVQTDLKKALAASTSAQYGLVFTAVGAGSPAAAAAHLATHAAFKSLLFLGAGVIIHQAGTGDLTRLRRRGGRVTPVLFAIGALALAAVPPLGGAASKEAVLAAGAGRSAWLGAGVVVAGLLSAFYAGRLHLLAFPADRPDAGEDGGVPAAEVGGMALLAVATVALSGLWLAPGRRLLGRVVGRALAAGGVGDLAVSVTGLVVVAAGLWALRRRRVLATLGLPAGAQAAVGDWLGLPVLGRRLVADPVLALAHGLAAVDDRVIDAGVRAAAAVATAASGFASWWAERSVDDVVWGVGAAALAAARGSRAADDRAVDGAVEGLATGVGSAGHQSRRLQTGLSHQYYLIVAAGIVAVALAAAVGRS